MSTTELKIFVVDAPWQKAFCTYGIHSAEFTYCRNLVNSERKSCRGKYHKANVHNLEKVGPKNWWSDVKRLCNFKTIEGLSYLTNVAEFSNLSLEEQTSKINTIFLDSLNGYSLKFPLPKLPLEESPVFHDVSEIMVHKTLSKLKINSAAGPDEIPNWCLKEYSSILALPVSLSLMHRTKNNAILLFGRRLM